MTAGWGQYRLFLDPQAAREARTVTHGLLTFGGGVNLKLGASSGLRFEIRDDVTLRVYDRKNKAEIALDVMSDPDEP